MSYTITQKDNYNILAIDEEKLMAETSIRVKRSFVELMQKKDIDDRWIIDLSNLKYIDSAGLGAFLTLYRLMRNTGRSLYFIGVHGHVQKLLSIAKLDRVFEMYNSVEAAAEAIKISNS